MKLSLQMFGNISTPDGVINAMLCRDADLPGQVMIHWFGSGTLRRAALLDLIPRGLGKYKGSLLKLYNAGSVGALAEVNRDELEEGRRYQVYLREEGNGFRGEWHAPSGGNGYIELFPGDDTVLGGLDVTTCADWDEFKKWATLIRNTTRSPAFRGHGWNEWPLQTTSYRAGLTRLERYYEDELVQFKHHAEATMDIAFDMSNGNDYATLLGLAQHHGLPTPLLDFTSSPYVAAYFAFADAIENKRAAEGFVRVYALDGNFLSQFAPALVPIATVEPYIASLTISARHNPRLYAQQGRFLVTNVGNLERWLIGMRHITGVERDFLFVADVPISCAAEALTDLRYMGLTAATLFPGLDGVCKMMKQEITLKSQRRAVSLLPDEGASLQEQPGDSGHAPA